VTINTETRKPAKIPPAVKQRFTQLAHDGHTIPTSETRRKLPEFVLPPQVSWVTDIHSCTRLATQLGGQLAGCDRRCLTCRHCRCLLSRCTLQLIGPSQLGRRSDMDPNGHINNVAYLAWALEVIPAHTYEGYHLTEVRVRWGHVPTDLPSTPPVRDNCTQALNSRRCPSSAKHLVHVQVEMDFKAECTAGDVIECCGMPLSQAGSSNGCTQQFLHLLRKGDSGAEVWRARTTWAPVKGASAPSGTGSSSSSSSSSSSKGEVANQSQLSPEKPANGTGGSTSSTGSSTTTSGSGSSAVALG
jgi:acyl-CoA thioesterase FadM